MIRIESHVGDEYLEEDNDRADLADRMSHSGGLKATETHLLNLNNGGNGPLQSLEMCCYSGTAVILLCGKGRRFTNK